ncbi:MAG: DUF2497 domain-containing protein [Alphaproteobacteria bacterium]
MAEQQKTEADPSIEEILDSIRQIISEEDDAPGASMEDDVIELTDKVDEPAPVASEPVAAVPQFAPEPEPEPQPEPARVSPPTQAPVQAKPPETTMTPPDESLTEILTKTAEDSVAGALSELTRRSEIQSGGGITIEDVVREEIKPLLRDWLDKYLPALVERLLQKELERISRRVQGD